MKPIHCHKCRANLKSGRIFYPVTDGFICGDCRAKIEKQKPVEIYVETDEFTGFMPVKYVERVDVT